MSDHHPEHLSTHGRRHCDVAVIGGSAAGLAAAVQLGRQRRSVIVVDAGEPRNARAAHLHGYLGFDGATPSDLLAAGREEVRSYGGEVLTGRVAGVARHDDGHFLLDLDGGHSVVARRVLAATGLVDELPDIDGLAEQWGRGVIHCPFCHGFEVRDRRIVQIVDHPLGLHTAGLFRQLSPELTVVLHDGVDVDESAVATLRAAGTEVIRARVDRIVTGGDGRISSIELGDRPPMLVDAVAIMPPFRPRLEALGPLGLHPVPHASGLGDVVSTDATGATHVPGVYAAGNVTDPSQQLSGAAADGGRVGAMISVDLADEDTRTGARPSANEDDWDHRYGGDQLWSGNPNGSLVQEMDGVRPGTALDVGAGEGGDAVWLAGRGWTVTASDISPRAVARIAAEAERRRLPVTCHRADANGIDAFGPSRFDLVSAHHASIPRTPDGRAIQNLLGAVAPGGTLLVVSHDVAAMRSAVGAGDHAPALRPRCLRAGGGHRGGDRRRTGGLGRRGQRDAPATTGRRLGLTPRGRRGAPGPTSRRSTSAPLGRGCARQAQPGSQLRQEPDHVLVEVGLEGPVLALARRLSEPGRVVGVVGLRDGQGRVRLALVGDVVGLQFVAGVEVGDRPLRQPLERATGVGPVRSGRRPPSRHANGARSVGSPRRG